MRVSRIELTNVRKHEKWAGDFGPGTVLLLGPNGSGKSSVLAGLAYAVFDFLPWKQSEFMRFGAKSFSVGVHFEHAGIHWKVKRGSGTYKVWKEGEEVSSGKGHSVAVLHEALNLPETVDMAALYRDALGGRQAGFTTGFDLSQAARVAYWGQVLGLDKYHKAWEKLRPVMGQLKDRVSALKTEILSYEKVADQWDRASLQDQLAVCVEEITAKQVEMAELNSGTADLIGESVRMKEAWERKEADIVRMRALFQEREEIEEASERQRTLADGYAELGNLPDNLAGWKALYEPAVFAELTEALEKLGSDEKEHYRTHTHMTSARTVLEEAHEMVAKAKGLSAEELDLSASVQFGDERLKRIRDTMAATNARVEGVVMLPEEDGPCPTCEQPMDAQRAATINAERERMVTQLTAEWDSAHAERNEVEDKLSEEVRRLDEVRSVTALCPTASAVKTMQDTLDRWEREYAGWTEQVTEMRAVVARLSEQATAQEMLKTKIEEAELRIASFAAYDPDEQERLVVRLKANKKECKQIQKRIDECPKEEEIQRALDTILERQDRVTLYLKEIADLQTRRSEMVTAKTVIDRIEQTGQDLAVAQAEFEFAEKIRATIASAGPVISDRTVQQVARLARIYWASLGHIEPLNWSSTYSLSVGARSFGLLSGGEQVSAALAMRLAIAGPHDLSWGCFDEPTGQLDEEVKESLARTLDRLPYEQTFVITHDETFAAYCYQVVRFGEYGL